MTEKEITKNMKLVAKVVKEHRQELMNKVEEDFKAANAFMEEMGIPLAVTISMDDFVTLYNMAAPEGMDILTLVCAANAACVPEYMELFEDVDNGTAEFCELFDSIKI